MINKKLKMYENRYASIHETLDGGWNIFNDVTGILVREVATYKEAITTMREIANYYKGIEYGRNGY